MFTILYRIVADDSCSQRSSTHEERIIGLFQTLQEAKETALRMAKPIFDKAYKAALENFSEEIRNIHDPDMIDQCLLPSIYEGEVGISVDYLTSQQEASRYQADSITHHFMIKEIETVFQKS